MSRTDTYLEAMRRDGYCIVEKAFTEDFCDRAVAALHRIQQEKGIRPSGQVFAGRKTIRVMNVLQYDDLFQEIPVNENFLPIVEGYLDEECLLSGIDSAEIYPGETGQAIHADTWWHDDRRLDFPIAVNTILALTDFTDENGATRLVPGSHLWTADQVAYEVADSTFSKVPGSHPKGYGTDWMPIAAEAPKGSVILYDSRLLHGAGENRSGQPRPSVISPYVLGWIRQLDNFAYAIPHDRALGFAPRLQRLIGLECFRGHYSQVNNMSPREWLLRGRQAELA